MAEEPVREITKEDIEPLPRWARVAFAARCARRVLPLYLQSWPSAPSEYFRVLQMACRSVANVAHHPSHVNPTALSEILGELERLDAHGYVGAWAARVVTAAVSSGANTLASSLTSRDDQHALGGLDVLTTIRGATEAARAGVLTGGGVIMSVMRRDLELLKALAAESQWTDDSGVDADLLGPLWPEGEPEGWPEDEAAKPKPFRFVLDPGDADAETIREVLTALSDLHEAHTGFVLTYEEEGCLVAIPQEVDA